ncbi:MAG: BMC domain-containing protein, partial [Clostridia bacterium]|nr:BMC domain-containing protein [Clostridia bacterium]
MKNRSIGMVEYQTVSAGMTAADLMVKTAGVEI